MYARNFTYIILFNPHFTYGDQTPGNILLNVLCSKVFDKA